MADLLDELQRMAANISKQAEIEPHDVDRWQRLFGFSYAQAEKQIERSRDDIGRPRVSDDHWQMVEEVQEANGHDRESYEYYLQHRASKKSPNVRRVPLSDKSTYVIKIEPPLETTLMIQNITGVAPSIISGTGETGTARFCRIDGRARQKIITWVNEAQPNFVPTIIRLSKSPKELCSISGAPFLGIDMTLPQYRAQAADFTPLPSQEQFPVWYFFYGNLAKSEELQHRLGLAEPPRYVPARVRGAQIRSWRGQYRALVDASRECVEEGSAFLVASKEDEDALRFYETEKYEVVRCSIEMEGAIEPGLVFRFAGGEDEIQ